MPEKPQEFVQRWLGLEFCLLLSVAILSVVNGREVLFLSTPSPTLQQIAILGVTGFSGGACVSVGLSQLTGSLSRRLAVLIEVYTIVSMAAFAMALALPVFITTVPDGETTPLLIFLYLVGLALRMGEFPGLRRLGKWRGFEAALQVLMGMSITCGFLLAWHRSLVISVEVNPVVMRALALALVMGFSLSLVGVLMGMVVHDPEYVKPLKRGTG